MLRKIIFVTCMAMFLTLTACGGESNSNTQTETSQPERSERTRDTNARPADPSTIPPELRHPDGTVG
jgi:hypothetical protein